MKPTLKQLQAELAQTQRERDAAMTREAALARIAQRYAQLAGRLGPLTPASGELREALLEYAAVFQATDAALRLHAEATRVGQTTRVNEARRELERLVRRQKTAASRIERSSGATDAAV